MNKKLPYDLTKEEIDELKKRKKEISDFVFEQFKSDPMNKEINWKEAHDMQQKLVVGYVLENEKLREAIKNFYEVKGRYNSQIAAAKMFELAGLPTQYPKNCKLD